MKIDLIDLDKKSDQRGYLFEIIRNSGQMPREKFGLIYYNVVNPGITKGNHYHVRKTEWYCVVKGTAKVRLVERKTGEKAELILSAEKPRLLRLDPGVTHNITNAGSDDMHFIGYIDEPYDEEDPDTVFEEMAENSTQLIRRET